MTEPLDVVVIGGGITGASAAYHLTQAGFRTMLLEKGDYGAGTTSRTSRLQHCGLGYLSPAAAAPFRFLRRPREVIKSLRSVKSAMIGRAEFVRAAPERVNPIDFVVPLNRENPVSRWQAQLGFTLLRILGGGEVPLDFRLFSARNTNHHPLLLEMGGEERLKGAVGFREYQYNWPERIVIDLVLAGRRLGLQAFNYSPVQKLTFQDNLWSVAFTNPEGYREVKARAVFNCAGIWVDAIAEMSDLKAPRLNAGQKGTNIAVRLPEKLKGTGLQTLTESNAPFYVIPWKDLHYIGPWDSEPKGTDADFSASEVEIESILAQFSKLFPNLALSREDVLYSWAGVRPRSADPHSGAPTGDIRLHDLTGEGLRNYFVFTGGLLMTHREAGRKMVSAAIRRLGRPGSVSLRQVEIPFASQVDGYTPDAVRHAIRHEQARTLADILRRRLSVGWDEKLGLDNVAETADMAAGIFGWSDSEKQRQVDAFREETVRAFGPRQI